MFSTLGTRSYNVVRWFMGENTGMAQAPSRVNPMTANIQREHPDWGPAHAPDELRPASLGAKALTAGHDHGRTASWQLQDSAAALALPRRMGR